MVWLAKTQIFQSNSFYHRSINHQRAMEIMMNSSLQKPFIHQKVGVKRKHLKNMISSSIVVKWKNGRAIPKVGCPEGINNLLILFETKLKLISGIAFMEMLEIFWWSWANWMICLTNNFLS
jgi:hypothetical protein